MILGSGFAGGPMATPHAPLGGIASNASLKALVRKTASVFECFPYVCPEPVLAKCSFLYTNGSKMPFFAGCDGGDACAGKNY
jgi:hypothetical protein